MDQQSSQISKGQKSGLIKSVIEESRKLRAERGEDFYSDKKSEAFVTSQVTAKIQNPSVENSSKTDDDFRSLRDSHVKLAHLVVDYDKKIFEQSNQVLNPKKIRSKSIHLYIDAKMETFLKTESELAHTKWGLRKNAGLGSLIQKFIGNFIELKKREERQLKRIRKIIDDFRSNLVEFKKNSSDPDDYQRAERSNQKMKLLSNDLMILLSLLEFENESLKDCLGSDQFNWVEFIIKWKLYS